MRSAEIHRKTKETDISLSLNIDGSGDARIDTPIGFLGHMLETMAKHALFDMKIQAQGDLHVDQHHLVEDLGITFGQALSQAVGDKRGIVRAGFFIHPMDESLAQAAVDLSGRPHLSYDVPLQSRYLKDFDGDLTREFFQGFANAAQATVHIRLLAQGNDHHRIEAVFKAFARALRQATSIDSARGENIPSAKGSL